MTHLTFSPKVDLHYHLDAMSPRAIKAVSERRDLPWAGKTLDEIRALATVAPGASWDDWYKVHTAARAAVFRSPSVFRDVAAEAITDAREEDLQCRVMRFSISMAEFAYQAAYGKKPDFAEEATVHQFRALFNEIVGNLCDGFRSSTVRAGEHYPLVFSFSCNPKHDPVLSVVADVIVNYKRWIAGIDLTNEQAGRSPAMYKELVDRLRGEGISALTVHVAEKDRPEKDGSYIPADERIRAALALQPNTIGHAIYAANYPAVIADIARSGVAVELCPTSNFHLNAEFMEDALGRGAAMERYPLRAFRQAGISCTVNSDVAVSVGGSLRGEYELLGRMLNLTEPEARDLDATARRIASEIYKV